VHLGLELRPAHLGIGFPGGHQDIDFLMNADLVGALQNNGWTAYATIGREPPNSAVRNGRTQPTAAFISYEHWISYQTDKGVTIRAGRFMPAYGVAFADHTAYTRIGLDHDRNQVYGLEVSDTIGPSLVQVMVGPGKAEAILHDSSRRGFSTEGRWQFDFSSRATIVGSPSIAARQRWIRSQAQEESPSASRLLLTCRSGRKSDTDLETKAAGGRSYVVVNETSIGCIAGSG
jgi:hypothetical protein